MKNGEHPVIDQNEPPPALTDYFKRQEAHIERINDELDRETSLAGIFRGIIKTMAGEF